jgi:hypothetical protein
MEASVGNMRKPAPCEGTGHHSEQSSHEPFATYRPWADTEISNCRPFALDHAAREAVRFAEAVFDLDLEADGLDWASRIQRRCDARPDSLLRRLPPGMTAPARSEVERGLAHA